MRPEQERSLALAEQAVGLSDPNPRVGCVIVCRDGQWVEGHTREAGGPHAEAAALQTAHRLGLDVRGGTAWVTLEPCSHQGRTPPCSQALIDAGIAHVHVAVLDPNPLVSGSGIAQLRQAGIRVDLHDDAWSRAAWEQNMGFHSRMRRGRPWVRMKMAASLDGTTALLNGRSQWITGEAARTDGHAWRRRAGAVLTGIGTVREDDPRLDVRLVSTERQPLRVVVDSRLEMSPQARVLQLPGRCLVYATQAAAAGAHRLQGLEGVEVAALPQAGQAFGAVASEGGAGSGKTDLVALVADLGARGINELHVEAGEKLNGSLLRSGCVDEVLLYLAPRLLGIGRGLAAVAAQPLESLDADLRLRFLDFEQVGQDLRLRALTPQGIGFWDAGQHPQA